MEGPPAEPAARAPEPHTQASLLAALTEAVRDRDERSLRRLLARFAEQATLTELRALREPIGARRRNRPHSR